MGLAVVHESDGHRLDGDGPITDIGNRFLGHLGSRGFSPATVRGYAYDLLNLAFPYAIGPQDLRRPRESLVWAG